MGARLQHIHDVTNKYPTVIVPQRRRSGVDLRPLSVAECGSSLEASERTTNGDQVSVSPFRLKVCGQHVLFLLVGSGDRAALVFHQLSSPSAIGAVSVSSVIALTHRGQEEKDCSSSASASRRSTPSPTRRQRRFCATASPSRCASRAMSRRQRRARPPAGWRHRDIQSGCGPGSTRTMSAKRV